MPLPIQIERLARAFVRVLGLQGFVPLSLLEDVQPILPIPVDEDAWRWSQGERRFGRVEVSVAVVGQFSQIIFGNPANSGVLAIIERMAVNACNIGPTAAQPPYTASIAPLDLRSPYAAASPTRSSAGMRSLSNAATIIGDPIDGPNAGYTAYQRPGIIVPPGQAFGFESPTVNTSVFASVWWREYPLAPQETVA